ncbi:MAG: ribbon-helix-helix protein, CopG family [Candidatus Latescibacteria bacterium]|nr:ribbon-helix-helix protein, CopG family [Candidatus Latescibacterota bacterium]
MSITIRLEPDLQEAVDRAAQAHGLTRSELVRECLQRYLEEQQKKPTPWELGKERFGKYASGRRDLSVDRKKILSEKLRARQNPR